MNMLYRQRRQQKGMTLFEVLVSIIILAVGLLGIASILILSSKANNSSYAKLQAIQCISDIFDRIRTNSAAAASGNYNASNIGSNGMPTSVATPSVLCNSSVCTPAQMAAYDVWYWLSKDVAQLPNGSGSITSTPSGSNTIITVTVQWDDSLAQSQLGAGNTAAANNANMVQLTIQSQL